MDNKNKAESNKNNLSRDIKVDETNINSLSNEPQKSTKTINIDGQRPVDPSNIEIKETIDIDGHRPITKDKNHSDQTIDIDGLRPIDKSNFEEHEMLTVDGKRPIDPSDLEVEEILDIDGQRPIARAELEAILAITKLAITRDTEIVKERWELPRSANLPKIGAINAPAIATKPYIPIVSD